MGNKLVNSCIKLLELIPCYLLVVDYWFMNYFIRPSKLFFGGGYGLKEG